MFGNKQKLHRYIVTVACSGRHPYLAENTHDFFKGVKHVKLTILAKDLIHAYKLADKMHFTEAVLGTKAWAYRIVGVAEHPEDADNVGRQS